ncbi:MAG: prolipoprotein diacylglyceryl transferase [Candidatus Gracilibacteria bacterium]|nr:prolipoprotein diacylglyceryl transferase [Candidatus Gracilibacteria bacterium]
MTIFEINLFGLHIAPTYYGLMYGISFIILYYGLKYRKFLDGQKLDDFIFYIFLGIILGGRLGYVVFYNLEYFLNNPLKIPAVWEGGMSFHGGVLGVIVALILFTKKYKLNLLETSDALLKLVPIGLFLGRIGNYINNELYGKEYSGPLAMIINGKTYFPSPLLEAFLEGIILFILLNFFWQSKKPGFISGAFLFFYGIFRFFIEFIRLPDSQIGYIGGIITMGQILSIPLIIGGIYLLIRTYDKK